jgi:hypothetical protein
MIASGIAAEERIDEKLSGEFTAHTTRYGSWYHAGRQREQLLHHIGINEYRRPDRTTGSGGGICGNP